MLICSFCLFFVSARLQVSFIPFISDTLAGDFLSALLIYRGKVELCHPPLSFLAEKNRNYFSKLKSAKINHHVFETKPRKFGDAKISHYTVLQ